MTCCGNNNVDSNDVKTDFRDHYNNVGIQEKVEKVVKVQSWWRGNRARAQVA